MVLPNLLHPIPIVIEQWVAATTIFDEETREPIQQSARAARETVMGQVSWVVKDKVIITEGGTRLSADGYILFRYVDLQAKSLVLKKQDAIKKIGWQDTNVFIIALKPTGHYPDQSGATMVKAYFNDRVPSRSA